MNNVNIMKRITFSIMKRHPILGPSWRTCCDAILDICNQGNFRYRRGGRNDLTHSLTLFYSSYGSYGKDPRNVVLGMDTTITYIILTENAH